MPDLCSPVINCTSFTLVRDVVTFFEGAALDRVQESCGRCDLSGKMQKWVAENPEG